LLSSLIKTQKEV